MTLSSSQQAIIDNLYALYQSKGFLREEEALDLMAANNVSLLDTQRLIEVLLGMGIIFADEKLPENEDVDNSQTDYETIFNQLLEIAPGFSVLIDYIRSIRPPQWREWRVLMPQAKAGNRFALNRLFEMYLRVVVKLALYAYKNNGYEVDDLFQEGALGLLRAIRNYDPNRHGSFVSYLPLWVKQYMDRAIADKSCIIRIPVHMHEAMDKFQSVKDKLELSSGRSPSIEAVADEMGTALEEAEWIQGCFYKFESIEDYILVQSDGFIDCNLIDKSAAEQFYELDNRFCQDAIISVLNTLTKRESSVLRLRFGIDDGYERTLEEVGTMYNVTRERIRQIEVKALRKLRHPSRSKKIKDFLTNIK